MEKIIFADETELIIKSGAGLSEITTTADNFTALGTLAETLRKKENLKSVKFVTDGVTTGEYEDLKLVTPLFKNVDFEGERVSATFGLAEKTEIEKEIELLKAGQAIQDGAIRDLGNVVSVIAEGADGGETE